MGKYFFTWVTPLVKYTKKYRKLKVEDLGDLKEEDRVAVQIENLRRVWDRKVAAGVNQNSLMKAVLLSFKGHYIALMLLNLLNACLNMSSPFIIKPLIDFVKTGENAWAPNIQFWDLSGTWLSFLSPEDQYGISLALILVFT